MPRGKAPARRKDGTRSMAVLHRDGTATIWDPLLGYYWRTGLPSERLLKDVARFSPELADRVYAHCNQRRAYAILCRVSK
jgi:hypothetical protein